MINICIIIVISGAIIPIDGPIIIGTSE